ncbi:hypothetical protein B7463_g8372, partial [Scytalidium lignicola]
MRGLLPTAIGALAATANAASSNTTCATGLYILCARGSGESADPVPKYHIPAFTGSIGAIAIGIAKEITGSVVAGVDYPATNPIPDTFNFSDPTAIKNLNLSSYERSEDQGTSAILEEVNRYHSSCPDSKIALLGYSQGAQVVRDSLCGGTGGDFNSDAPLSPDLVKKNVVAVALMGDPTHIINEPIDRGTSTKNGRFPRNNITVCQQYDDVTASWCDKNDAFCDSGDSIAVHESYGEKYATDIVQFVVEKWNSTLHSSSDSSENATTGSSTSPSTSSPSPSSSSQTGSASSLVLSQSLFLGGMMLLAVCLLF